MIRRLAHRALQYANTTVSQFRGEPGDEVGEGFYASIYLAKIKADLSQRFPDRESLKILDAGCGMGAAAVPLAVAGHQVTGIDLHKPSLDTAARNAAEAGVSPTFINADLLRGLKAVAAESMDVVVCLGVLYTCVDFKPMLREMSRVLVPDGVFFGTFRTPHYFITTLLRKEQYDAALFVSKNIEGALRIARAPTYYNWQTPEQLRTILEECELSNAELQACGLFTGAHGDGLAAVANVHEVPERVLRTTLFELESRSLPESVGAARFMFATAVKHAATS
jgi:2-polyprenyl-3-methyl-5-hydroxy-6-metoxy-1,4-benzoquinol methylase